MDQGPLHLQGRYRDLILDGKGQICHDSGWRCNTIVLSCRHLLAAFIKRHDGATGISYMDVGRGEEAWDNQNEPPHADPVNPDHTRLVNRYERNVQIDGDAITYLLEDERPTNNIITHRLQVTVILPPGVPQEETSALREFGLFGNIGSQPYMINNVRHKVINKTAEMTLTRVIQLEF